MPQRLPGTFNTVSTTYDPLDELSDEELIGLYISTYEESLRRSVIDQSSLVAPGRCVIQAGYTFTYDEDPLGFSVVEHTVPQLLARYRLLDRIELRLAWSGATFDEFTDDATGFTDSSTSWGDPSIGARISLCSQYGVIPRTSLTVATPFNTDSEVDFFDRMNPFLSLSYSWFVGERYLLSGASGAVWTLDGGE